MKIAIITNLYPPYARGGAEVVITRTVTELLAQGHEVVIVTSCPRGKGCRAVPTKKDESGALVYRFFPINLYHTLNDHAFAAPFRLLWHVIDMFNPLNAFFVGRVLQRERPDVVFVHNLKGIGLTIPLAIRALKIPRIHFVHDVQLVVPSGLVLAGKEKPPLIVFVGRVLHRAFARALFGSPDLVISPSKFLKRFYKKHKLFRKSEIKVIPNPAPNIKVLDRGERIPGPLRLLFVGQVETHKGIKFLIKNLEDSKLEYDLVVAGEGSKSGWLRHAATQNKKITYVEFVAMRQLLQLFNMADMLVVPSLCYENSPTVIYEALQAGLPVIAADIGGVAELIQERKNGYLFHPGDDKDFQETIRVVDKEKDRFRGASLEIRSTVAEHAIDKYVERIVGLAEEIIN